MKRLFYIYGSASGIVKTKSRREIIAEPWSFE